MTVRGGNRIGMVIVVPAFSMRQKPNDEIIAAVFFRVVIAVAPTVRHRINRPGVVPLKNGAHEDAPNQQAQAKLNALSRGNVTISLTLKPGDPTVAAEARLTLSGFRTGVDGEWIATQVTHEVGSSGYTTRVEAETMT